MKKCSKPSVSRLLYIAALVILFAVFLISAGALIKYYTESRQSKQTYQQLQALRGNYARPAPALLTDPGPSSPSAIEPPSELVTVTDPDTGQQKRMLPEMADLYLLNTDLVGWLTIPGTNVDYPVAQRPESADYYLYRDFYGKQDSHGCLYAREVCDVAAPSDNITIYGHRMKDRTMLSDLGLYETKSFWQENQYLFFDTLTERHTYQIICVFTTTASVGEGFQYHLFVDAADRQEFDTFMAGCTANRLYDTGLTAAYGDKLLTLSTCEYTHTNGRLVVVAKRID